MDNDYRKLTRSKTNRMVCGVCGGLGEYLNIDPTIIRIIWLLCALAGLGQVQYLSDSDNRSTRRTSGLNHWFFALSVCSDFPIVKKTCFSVPGEVCIRQQKQLWKLQR